MQKHLSAEDIFPLVDRLSPDERLRLLRFITVRPATDDQDAYRALPPRSREFSNDEDLIVRLVLSISWFARLTSPCRAVRRFSHDALGFR